MFATDVFAPTNSSSFSHGFFRLAVIDWEACPSSTVPGTSLIPGTGRPLVMSSTTWLKDTGYGAVASETSRVVSIGLREVETGLGGLFLAEEGLDAEDVKGMSLAREGGC